MTEETGASVGGSAVDTPAQDIGGELTIDQAVGLYVQPRKPDKTAESANDATAEQESPEGDADPVTDPGETQEAEAEKEPPIERPKSWSKDEDAEWQSLPRAMQQKIVARESERDKGTSRSQQEAAEARKAAEAARQLAEEARQQYLSRVPTLDDLQRMVNQGPFADIKSHEDKTNLLKTDPFRYLEWQDYQDTMGRLAAQAKEAQDLKAREEESKWAAHVQEQNAKLLESVPEKERGTIAKMRDDAPKFLMDKGFKDSELGELATGKTKLSIFDHRIQGLIRDSMKLQEILSAPKAVAAKPIPPVQKPGTSSAQTGDSQRIQALQSKFERDPTVENAMALRLARQRRA